MNFKKTIGMLFQQMEKLIQLVSAKVRLLLIQTYFNEVLIIQ